MGKCDVTQPDQVEASVLKTVEIYGSIDKAFNNAGWAGGTDFIGGKDVSPEDWKKTMDINVNGVFYSTKYEIEAMLKHGKCDTKKNSCSIVNCASIYGLTASPFAPAYATSKHSLIGLTKSFAQTMPRRGSGSTTSTPLSARPN